MRAPTRLDRRRTAVLSSVVGLTMIGGLTTAIPSGAIAAPAGDLIITGSVVRANASYETVSRNIDLSSLSGAKPAGGAYVELMWAKTDLRDESDGTKPGPIKGDRTSLVIVGTSIADAKGQYTISGAPSADVLRDAAENAGWVNFLVATVDGADYVLEYISRHWDGKKWTSFGDERPDQSPDRQYRTVFATDVKTGEKKYGTDKALLNKARKTDVTPYSISGCDYIHRSFSYGHTVVMEFHNTADADGHWEYGGTADSTIDAGVKYDGSNWTIGGSKQISNGGGSAIGQYVSSNYGKYVATNFRYRHATLIHKSTAWCDWNGDDAILPDRWEGGGQSFPWDVSQYDCQDYPQYNYRDRYEIGGYFKKFESRAAKIGIAINVGPINLGATSGYSSRVDMDWRAVRNFIYICGNNAYPRYAQIVYTW